MEKIKGFELSESDFQDILQALHSEAHNAVNHLEEGQYNRFMRLSATLTAQRVVLMNLSARRNKVNHAIEEKQVSVKVQSSMNWDDTPTFSRSSYAKY